MGVYEDFHAALAEGEYDDRLDEIVAGVRRRKGRLKTYTGRHVHIDPHDTEVIAYDAASEGTKVTCDTVLHVVRKAKRWGLTAEEVCEELGVPPHKRTTAGPRLTDLAAQGLIIDSGYRRKGPNQTTPSIVWIDASYAKVLV